jgi:hypothetical protein
MRNNSANIGFTAPLFVLAFFFSGCLFNADIAADEEVWMSIAPIQCGGNAWEIEEKTVEKYLEDRGVDVIETETTTFADDVCLACSCVNGQRLDILVSEDDVSIMLVENFILSIDWPY